MKARIFTLVAALALSAGTAKAHGSHNPPPPPPPPSCPPSNHLPIDGNIAFLMIAGTVIGIVALKKTNRALKPATVKARY